MKDFNVYSLLVKSCTKNSKKVACIFKDDLQFSFTELLQKTDQYAEAFYNSGIRNQTKVVTFVKPGPHFVPTVMALFKIGAVPVFIDPGMKLKNILACVKEVKPDGFVGINLAFLVKYFFKNTFKSVKHSVNVDKIALSQSNLNLKNEFKKQNDLACILFTSGSTGIPKGVEVTHGILYGQQEVLKETYQITQDEIDLVVFPLFALFSVVWGITSVIADMNPAKPAKVNGKKLYDMIVKYKVTHTAGSPAIWDRLFLYCETNNKKIKSLKRILMAGAPVSPELVSRCSEIITGQLATPYGATEALPLTSISNDELLNKTIKKTFKGSGTCVGKPLNVANIKIIKSVDGVISNIEQAEVLAVSEIGEVIVNGPLVTRRYYNRLESTKLSKIEDKNIFWHRMGDLGYFDTEGNLWFCGRKDHAFSFNDKMYYPVQLEGYFNNFLNVKKTALVMGKSEPILVVEGSKNKQVMDLFMGNSQGIKNIYFEKKFPVDVRHNIKINRPKISKKLIARGI